MRVSTGRDYESFRALWLTVDEPFARQQFERGWKSLRSLQIDILQKIRDPLDQSIFYGVYAVVEIDPNEVPEGEPSRRRVVLELRKEAENWRLANASDKVRAAVLELYRRAHPDDPQTKPPSPPP